METRISINRSLPITGEEEMNVQLTNADKNPLPIDIFNLFIRDEVTEYIPSHWLQ